MKTAVRETSLAAYDQLKTGALGRQQAQIVRHMAQHVHRDWTRRELVDAVGMTVNAVAGRVFELIERGMLIERRLRKCSVTGRTVHALELAPVQNTLDLAA